MRRSFSLFVVAHLSITLSGTVQLTTAAAGDPVKQLSLPGEAFVVDGCPGVRPAAGGEAAAPAAFGHVSPLPVCPKSRYESCFPCSTRPDRAFNRPTSPPENAFMSMSMTRSLAAGMLVCANLVCGVACGENRATDVSDIAAMLTPRPQQVLPGAGHFSLRDQEWAVSLPDGPEQELCRSVLTTAWQQAGMKVQEARHDGHTFVIGQPVELPALPHQGHAEEAYVLCISPAGVMARGASPAGILYASQTLRQLLRIFAETGRLPCLTIVDYPTFRMRGVYIEGGQERFGRIVEKNYLLEQIQRLAEFKMNTLVIECYNLFPFASFPACADEGTLSETDCSEIVAESKRCHVTLVPSLQTLAQASELVWNCPEGSPFREATAPGLMCPSNPALYPFITGLYRDLLQRFDDSPLIGVGCSEIDMQWQGRYCPACRPRIDAGETVRDLLLGHAEKCIAAVHSVSAELGRPVRPLMWADEFYMYGPGKDWVGIERIPHDTVMGYWKYWSDYSGIDGLLERGYDVLVHEMAIAASLLSLGAIDFGILVDGSVVMTEANLRRLTQRQLELGRALTGEERLASIAASSKEVVRPIVFGMGIIILVFLPVLTLQGVEGKMFKPMAWTFIFAMLGALLVAVFLNPILSWRFLPNKAKAKEARLSRLLKNSYLTLLQPVLRHRLALLAVVTVLLAGTTFSASASAASLPRMSKGSTWWPAWCVWPGFLSTNRWPTTPIWKKCCSSAFLMKSRRSGAASAAPRSPPTRWGPS